MRRLLLITAAVFLSMAIDGILSDLVTRAHAAPANAPTFYVVDTKCSENVGSCIVAISVGGGNGRGSWINAATSNGTATAPGDYGARNAPIYVSPGRTASVTIPIVDDKLLEGDEYFFVTITAKQNAIIGRARAVVTIVDNDIPPPPPPPPPPVVCPDGTTVPAGQTCPPPPPPPPTTQWVSAPLQDGGFARIVNASDSLWPVTAPGPRPLVNGEIVAVYFNGWGVQADNQPSFAVLALSDQASGRMLASSLQGIAPIGAAPALPADWWVPGLVTANKTCGSAGSPGQPGVVQGGTYRAAMIIGTHMALATGQTGAPQVMWRVFATGAQQYATAEDVVAGDCLTGQ